MAQELMLHKMNCKCKTQGSVVPICPSSIPGPLIIKNKALA